MLFLFYFFYLFNFFKGTIDSNSIIIPDFGSLIIWNYNQSSLNQSVLSSSDLKFIMEIIISHLRTIFRVPMINKEQLKVNITKS